MNGRFQGRVAIITGAGSGIGRAAALRFAREGGSVLLVDVDSSSLEAVVATIRDAGGNARAHRADVTRVDDVRAMFAAAEATFGGIDVICNNAGVLTRSTRLEETDDAEWERTLAVNLRGVILGCKYGIPFLRRRGGGGIVNTASMAGITGFDADSVYAASKGGVVTLTRSLRALASEAGIRVNCVCPSFVDTPMVQQAEAAVHRAVAGFGLLTAEAIAEVILFLASDEAADLAGRAVRVVAGEPPALLANPRPDRPLFEKND